MASRISVTPEELKKAASIVDEKTKDYEMQYKKLLAEVANLKGSWEGDANKQYAAEIQSFESEFKNLKLMLDGYVAFLQKASDAYKNTEETIVQNAAKLKGRR